MAELEWILKDRQGVMAEMAAEKEQSTMGEKFLALGKRLNCANLASEDDSGKTAVEKSGCCKLAKTLT